ncbi:MAG: signal peptide peptidase SppA [bacterium]
MALFLAILAGFYGFVLFLQESVQGGERRIARAGGGSVVGLLRIQGGIFGARETLAALARFRRNPKVKSLLIRIESPGGAVSPTQEIYHEVLRFRRSGRKVVASLGTVAASGGYYIAAAADKIFANPGTITGSIGVIMMLPNAEKALGKLGLKFSVIKSAPHKDLASPWRSLTEKDREILQRLVDDTYGQFVRAVAKGRNLPEKKVLLLADGSVFSGERAKTLGLVDELGSLRDAALEAARLAGIEGEPKLLELTPKTGLLRWLGRQVRASLGWLGGGGTSLWGDAPAVLQYMWK